MWSMVLLCRWGSKTAALIIRTCLHEMKSLLEITLANKLSSGWKMDVTHSRWGSINSSTAVITPWFIREGCGWLTLPATGVVSEQTGRWKRSCVLSKCPVYTLAGDHSGHIVKALDWRQGKPGKPPRKYPLQGISLLRSFFFKKNKKLL